MAIFKATFIFECNNKGWSESYYRTGAGSDPITQQAIVEALITKRMPLSGKEVNMTYYRIANVEQTRRVKLVYLADERPGSGAFTADNPETCLILKMADAAAGRQKTTFLRGIWDNVVDKGGLYRPTVGYEANVIDFQNALKNDSWGWLGVNVQTTQPLATLVQDAAGTVSGTVTANLFDVGLVGKTVTVRFRKITQPGNLNGSNPVVVLSQTAFRTVKRIAILPWSGDGNILLSTKNVVPISNLDVTGVSERKTGRVFGSPRGRQPVRRRA